MSQAATAAASEILSCLNISILTEIHVKMKINNSFKQHKCYQIY